jgi:hypothetical protein
MALATIPSFLRPVSPPVRLDLRPRPPDPPSLGLGVVGLVTARRRRPRLGRGGPWPPDPPSLGLGAAAAAPFAAATASAAGLLGWHTGRRSALSWGSAWRGATAVAALVAWRGARARARMRLGYGAHGLARCGGGGARGLARQGGARRGGAAAAPVLACCWGVDVSVWGTHGLVPAA